MTLVKCLIANINLHLVPFEPAAGFEHYPKIHLQQTRMSIDIIFLEQIIL